MLRVKSRVLEFMDYMAEEVLGPPYTISPGCKGSLPGGRCKFSEFLSYNWTGNSKTPPTGYKFWPNLPSDITTLSIKDVAERLITAKFNIATKKGVAFKPTSAVDPKKLRPGSPQPDYLGVRTMSGSRVAALAAKTGTLPGLTARIVKLARDAGEASHELRYEDNEKFRLNFFNKILSFRPLTTPYTIKTMGRTFNRLDAGKTAGIKPGALKELVSAQKKYLATDKMALSHWTMTKASLRTRIGLICRIVLKP
ncbi:hypothetical protein NX059_010070 [Plenodomus lindquistii]|nr:hypothetical protein NX059_010070 [Plenodomus lindquistii]